MTKQTVSDEVEAPERVWIITQADGHFRPKHWTKRPPAILDDERAYEYIRHDRATPSLADGIAAVESLVNGMRFTAASSMGRDRLFNERLYGAEEALDVLKSLQPVAQPRTLEAGEREYLRVNRIIAQPDKETK